MIETTFPACAGIINSMSQTLQNHAQRPAPRVFALFTAHPATVGETYTQHLGTALGFAGALFVGALACAVHAVLPFLFVKTGSATITRLYQRMVTHRDRRAG
jgi:hypothetical protein